MQFIGEQIDVETAGDVKQPRAFTWRGRRHDIATILVQWFDWGFSSAASQKNWKTRRHRNCYRVETAGGETFELYCDRGRKNQPARWYLYQQLDREQT